MNVLIVESAAKARTLRKYLGDGWRVVATGGHVETLPDDRKKHGKDARKAYWANRAGELPSPPWVWTDRGEKAVNDILEASRAGNGSGPSTFWVATDPDREGEFIAWCLERRLREHGTVHRVTFQEVTAEAVKEAIEHPRPVDAGTVDSALVRKFLDRLVGFRTSKMASSIVGRGASMGRVQTPTLGFIVDRELEREAFVPTEYFEVRARAEGVDLKVRFHERGDPELWTDNEGRSDPNRTFDGDLAQRSVEALEAAGQVTLRQVRSGTNSRKPPQPYSTDALLQDAGSRLGWSPRKTSAVASRLYEAGHITYIRTDSTRLADSAVEAARAVVGNRFGPEFLSTGPRGTAAGGKAGGGSAGTAGPVQDAHEAIRPSRLDLETVEIDEDEDAGRLYRLVRARTLASQMKPATSATRRIEAACEGLDRALTGSVSWRTFLGWEAAYDEFEPARPTAPPDIPLTEGATWTLDRAAVDEPNPVLIEDETRPPSRYSAAGIVKKMKDEGIGRPSTYARTVDKLEERGYLETEGSALIPTDRGRAVWLDAAPLYALDAAEEVLPVDAGANPELPQGNGVAGGASGDDPSGESDDSGAAPNELFDTRVTALMEEGLDRVASGTAPAPRLWETWRDRVRALHEAAQARKKAGASTPKQQAMLRRILENASEEIDPETLSGLTYQEALDLTRRLRDAGVEPAPSQAQMDLIEKLLSDLDLTEEEVTEVVGSGGLEAVRTTPRASRIIDELQRIHDERRPPSAKQRRYIEALLEETRTSEAEAVALVGVDSLDDLTGGREGTASALIDALDERKKAAAVGQS